VQTSVQTSDPARRDNDALAVGFEGRDRPSTIKGGGVSEQETEQGGQQGGSEQDDQQGGGQEDDQQGGGQQDAPEHGSDGGAV
jgi:hypothetical protein